MRTKRRKPGRDRFRRCPQGTAARGSARAKPKTLLSDLLPIRVLGGRRSKGRNAWSRGSQLLPRGLITCRQAVALSERQFATAKYLLAGKFNAQAVARGYYSLYTLLCFVARRNAHWRWPAFRDGSPRPAITHEDAPGYVSQAVRETQGHRLDARQSQINAQELLAQRLAADYYGHQEIGEAKARGLLVNCQDLRSVLLLTTNQYENEPVLAGR